MEKTEKAIKTVIESHHSAFKPVGQDEKCAFCASGCKTSCVRLMNTVDVATQEVIKHSQSGKKQDIVKGL